MCLRFSATVVIRPHLVYSIQNWPEIAAALRPRDKATQVYSRGKTHPGLSIGGGDRFCNAAAETMSMVVFQYLRRVQCRRLEKGGETRLARMCVSHYMRAHPILYLDACKRDTTTARLPERKRAAFGSWKTGWTQAETIKAILVRAQLEKLTKNKDTTASSRRHPLPMSPGCRTPRCYLQRPGLHPYIGRNRFGFGRRSFLRYGVSGWSGHRGR